MKWLLFAAFSFLLSGCFLTKMPQNSGGNSSSVPSLSSVGGTGETINGGDDLERTSFTCSQEYDSGSLRALSVAMGYLKDREELHAKVTLVILNANGDLDTRTVVPFRVTEESGVYAHASDFKLLLGNSAGTKILEARIDQQVFSNVTLDCVTE